MKHGLKKTDSRRNRLAAELFSNDAPFHHRVERDRKADYRRHMKHEPKWLEEALKENQ